MLLALLNENSIKLNVDVKDSEDAIRTAGTILVNNNQVETSYVDSMVTLSKEIPGYIVLAPGMAMPHARPENGVKTIGMSLVTLKTPVAFGNVENDPVNVVIALAAVDSTTHIELLQQFSSVFDDDAIIEKIAQCDDASQVLTLLKEQLGE